jgi:hypothetical protein
LSGGKKRVNSVNDSLPFTLSLRDSETKSRAAESVLELQPRFPFSAAALSPNSRCFSAAERAPETIEREKESSTRERGT